MRNREEQQPPAGRRHGQFPPPRPAGSAVDKALDLIEATARSTDGLRLSELAEQVGLHRATAYRVLGDLVRRNWVLRYDGRYLPGTALLQLSQRVSARSIATICRPALESLAERTSMMSNLQVLEPDGSRVIDAVRPPRYRMIIDLLGDLLVAHRFAGPLALVAALPADRRGRYLELAAADGYPLDGPGGLHQDLAETQRTGYALVRRRNDDIVASMSCVVPSPTEDPLCALTVVGLDAEFDPDRLERIRRELTVAVAEVRALLSNEQPEREGAAHDRTDRGSPAHQ